MDLKLWILATGGQGQHVFILLSLFFFSSVTDKC